jgi:hypothetical protein
VLSQLRSARPWSYFVTMNIGGGIRQVLACRRHGGDTRPWTGHHESPAARSSDSAFQLRGSVDGRRSRPAARADWERQSQARCRHAEAGFGREHGGEQRPSVGMVRRAEQRPGLVLLDNAAEIHDRNPRRHVPKNREQLTAQATEARVLADTELYAFRERKWVDALAGYMRTPRSRTSAQA